jgi:hypothetical protein
MLKPFSQYLKAVEEHLPSEHHPLLRNGLYLAILDWYTDGVEPREAAARISHAVTGEAAPAHQGCWRLSKHAPLVDPPCHVGCRACHGGGPSRCIFDCKTRANGIVAP